MTTNAEAALETIELHVGNLNTAGRAAALAAIAEDIDGCITLAKKIAKREDVKNPPGLYLACLASGEHKTRATAEQRNPKRIPPADAFRRLYNAKIAELRDVTDWPLRQMVDFAIDYAASSLDRCQVSAYPLGQNVNTLEDDLRREIGQPRYPVQAKAAS